MKIALSYWNGRIAPVFDVSARCLIIDRAEAGRLMDPEPHGSMLSFSDNSPEAKTAILKGAGVGLLLCGALSSEYQASLLDAEIEVIPFVSGPVDRVCAAWAKGALENESFSMPGCSCPRRRRCRQRRHGLSLPVHYKGEDIP